MSCSCVKQNLPCSVFCGCEEEECQNELNAAVELEEDADDIERTEF